MKSTILLYRLDGRRIGGITDRCPITEEEADKIKDFKERCMWTGLCGVNDENMRAFRMHSEKAIKKLQKELATKSQDEK